jgi:hypothetical protein
LMTPRIPAASAANSSAHCYVINQITVSANIRNNCDPTPVLVFGPGFRPTPVFHTSHCCPTYLSLRAAIAAWQSPESCAFVETLHLNRCCGARFWRLQITSLCCPFGAALCALSFLQENFMLRFARNDGLIQYRLDNELREFQVSSQHLVNISL